MDSVNILIVDDSSVDRFILVKSLQRMSGIKSVLQMDGGEAALEYLQAEKKIPEILFIDINMPGMNGFALAEKIVALPYYQENVNDLYFITSIEVPDRMIPEIFRDRTSNIFQKTLGEKSLKSIVEFSRFKRRTGISF